MEEVQALPVEAKPLRILLFAQEKTAEERLIHEIEACELPHAINWVRTESQFRAALALEAWDVIVTGIRLPAFVANALGEKERSPPLICIFDELTDEEASEALRSGAQLSHAGRSREHLRPALLRIMMRAWQVHHRQQLEAFNLAQLKILERVAEGYSISDTLESIVLLIEGQVDGICSILFYDQEKHVVTHGAAPHLPPDFIRAIDGSSVGPEAGSCGTAAFRAERVIVSDIANDPLWTKYKELALPFGLRACWSSPIFSPAHDVLGTFAVYYDEVRSPTEEELHWIDSATHLSAIAIMKAQNETALINSEARYRLLLETSHEGIITLDTQGRITFANRRAAEMVGYSPEDLMSLSMLDLFDPAERSKIKSMLSRRHRGLSDQYEARFKTKDGEDLWAIVAASPIWGRTGELTGTLGMVTDISDRKSAEAELARSERELRTIFDGAAIGIALVDSSTRPLQCNPAFERLLGYSSAELSHMTLLDVTHPDEPPINVRQLKLLERERKGPHQREMRFVKRGGQSVWGRVTVSLLNHQTDNQAVNAVVMMEDVSERKRLMEEVQSAERVRSLIFDSVGEVLYFIGVEKFGRFRFLEVNDAFLRATGLGKEKVVGKFVDEVIPEPSLSMVLEKYRCAIFERRSQKWDEMTVYPAGTKHGEVAVTPVFNRAGDCEGLVGTVYDITERKEAEEKIAAQAALLDHARDAILVRAIDGTILFWNQGATRLYGWTEAEVAGKNIAKLLYRSSEVFDEATQRVIAEGSWSGELKQVTKFGRDVFVEGSWTLLRDSEGHPSGVLTINTDVTEKKALRAQIALSQRMESLGELAGGIAHDFNNILTGIMGNLDLAQAQLSSAHPAQKRLNIALTACHRAVELVRRILTFSRQAESHMTSISLQPVIEEALQLLRASLPAMVEVHAEWKPDIPDVVANAGQIHQIVMNLGANAAQAMNGRGKLVIRLEPVIVNKPLVGATSHILPGRYARLSVEDTGAGIDEKAISRIFEPFFTTKEPGRGTGLGLSVVHGIVKDHGGHIVVRSRPGLGTSFRIYFPEARIGARSSPLSTGREAPSGQGKVVLYVDDEASILAVSTEILTSHGYRVKGFTEPARALQEFRNTPKSFDVLITDFAMPSMSGIELAKALLRIRPEIPIVLVSGHLSVREEREAQRIGISAVLTKPGSINEMLSVLDQVIQGRSQQRKQARVEKREPQPEET